MQRLAHVYLAFLNHMQKPDGNFHNYLGYDRSFLDIDGSEDCAGRTLWACGCTLNSQLPRDMRLVAKDIFDRGLPWVWKSMSLRFYSSAILGLAEYYQALPSEDIKANSMQLADSMVQRYRDEAKENWRWFEPHLTYGNARLTQALYVAFTLLKEPRYLEVAEEAMDFLLQTQMLNGVYAPIGNDGWYRRGEKRALYDQQPIEAACMVEAAVDAYYATKKRRYLTVANQVFGWFLGRNSRGEVMYNCESGGCYDGLGADWVNMNQGAESSICYLLARLKLEEAKQGAGWQKRI
ncbi:MAG: glycosyltransferase [Candidatus Bathyarchaeota archaeon]|nr:glycosyltransferase [Candidatus Bathyarchaeota archaeon]